VIAERSAGVESAQADARTAQLDMARYGKLAADGDPDNVELVEGEDSATGLAGESCDLIFLSAVWHEIDDHAAAFAEQILTASYATA